MLIKPIFIEFTPAVAGHPAAPATTECPSLPPPNNGGGGGGSGGGSTTTCLIVPNQYGGSMQMCFG